MEKTRLHKMVMDLVDAFLEDQVHEFNIKLNSTFSEEEFDNLVGKAYDSSNSAIDNGVVVDEYVYSFTEDIVKKLIVVYVKQPENKFTITRIQGFNDWVVNNG